MKKYLNLFDFSQKVNYRTEILSGLTVALALVPEAIAFAFIAGLSPLTGLYAAFVLGLVTSILGAIWCGICVCHSGPSRNSAVAGRGAPIGKIDAFGATPCYLRICEWTSDHHFYVAARSV